MLTVWVGASPKTADSSGKFKAVSVKTVATALMASVAFFSFGTQSAMAATCNAANDAQFDACVAGLGANDTIILTGAATLDTAVVPAGVTIQVNSGGALTDTVTGNFGPSTNVVINAGGSITTLGTDTFATLNGAGTLNTPSGAAVLFGNASASAFSGTWVAPDLNTALVKQGAGTHTINGMTAANGDFLQTAGVIAQSAGTTNIKSLAVGSGTGGTGTTNVTGGTLNFTGNFPGAPPCGSQCPALRIGDFTGTGIFNQSAGVVNVGAANVAASMNIGNQGGNGTYNMSGGTLNLGVLGDVNSAGLYAIGRQASASVAQNGLTTTGVFNISGGTVNVNAGELINGDRDAGGAVNVTTNSTINLSGGVLSVKNGANLWLSAYNNNAAVDSVFNLTGGTLEIGDGRLQAAYGGGTGVYQFNLGNGTIKVIDSALTTTVNATLTGGSAATGVKIDTNGIGANWNGILSGTGWLVKTGAGNLTLGGVNTYTGGTAFNGGNVVVDSTTDLGANLAGLSFDGGTLTVAAAGALGNKAGASATFLGGGGTINTVASTIFDANITGFGSLNKVGAGTLDLGGNNNAHTGGVNILQGTLQATFGNAIGNTSAVMVNAPGEFRIAGGNETIGSLTGNGLVTLNGNTLITGNNGATTAFNGTFDASNGGLTKVGVGTFTINGNTTYTGLTTVNGGQLNINGTMSDGLLVASGGRFGGNATVTGNVTNNGTIAPGNSPGIQTYLANYTAGAGATFDMEVQFNNAGAPVNGTTHDFIQMTNGAATITGTTLINVIPFAPSGTPAATTGNGIELVRVAAPVTGSQFQLAAPVVQGPYQYLLTYRQNWSGSNDSWFLTSTTSENMYGEAAMFSSGQAMFNSCFRGEDSLAGDGNGHVGRAWAKFSTGNRDTKAASGIESSNDYSCGQGGIDIRTGGRLRFGVSGGYGESDTDVVTPTGIGRLNGDGGLMELYAAFHQDIFFVNASLGYGNMNWTFDGAASAPLTAATGGMVGSLSAGAVYPMGDFRFSAIGEVNFNDFTCGDHCLLAGTTEDVNSFFGRGTLRVDAILGKFVPFVSASLSSGSGNTVTNGTASITTDTESSILTVRGGAAINVSENAALFASAGMVEGLSSDVDGWNGTGGVRIFW